MIKNSLKSVRSSSRSRHAALLLAGSLTAFLGGTTARAAVETWTGTTNNNWNTGTNWSGANLPPISNDSLVFTSATGAGGLLLNNNLTSGAFNIAGITYNAGAGAFVIGNGTATANAGNTFVLAGSVINNSTSLQTINNPFSVAAVQTFTTSAGGGNITLGGNISGAGGITKTGTGALSLTGASNYTGNTLVTDGLLSVTGGGSVNNTTNLFVNNGGNVDVIGGTVTAQNFGVGYNAAGTSTVTVGAAGTLTIGNTGPGNGGNLVFIGGSSNGAGGPGGTAGTGILNINAGATVNVAASAPDPLGAGFPNNLIYLGGYAGTGIVNLNTGGTLATGRGFGTGAGNTFNFNGGTLRITSASFTTQNGVAFTLQDNGAIIDTNGFNVFLGNALVHGGAAATDGGLIKQGAGTLTLDAANSYTGTTTLTGGTLNAVRNGSLGSSGPVVFNGGTLLMSNGITLTKNFSANAATTSAVVFAGGEVMNGALTGTGTVNFSTTAAGGVNIPVLPTFATFGGTIGVDTSNNFFFPTVTNGAGAKWVVNGGGSSPTNGSGGFLFSSTQNTTIQLGELSGNGRVGSSNGTTTWQIGALNTNSTFSGTIFNNFFSGIAAISKVGTGTLTLTGPNPYTGGTLVSGGLLSVTGGGSISNTDNLFVNSGGNVNVTNGTITARNFGVGYNAAGLSTVTVGNAGVLTIGNTGAGNAGGASNLVFIGGNSNGSGGNSGTAGNGVLTINAGGAVNVAAAGSFPNQAIYLGGYNGTGVINLNGGVLTTARNIETGTSGNSINLNGGTLAFSVGNIAIQDVIPLVSGAGTTSAIITAGDNPMAQNTLTGTGRVNFSTSAAGGTNIPTLPNFSAFTGTVGIDTSNNFYYPSVTSGANAKWVVNGGGTGTTNGSGGFLFSNAQNTTIQLGELSGNGRVGSSNGVTTWEIGALNTNSTFSGIIFDNFFGGTAAVTKVGTGALTLSGVNSHSSGTRVNAGSLILSAANTMTGSTTPAGGTLVLNHAQALQNSTLVMNAGDTGTVSFNTPTTTLGGLSGARNLNLGTTAVSVGNNNTSTSYSGTLSGGNGLTKIGTGTLTLSGTQAYNGPTTIASGTLRLGGGNIPDNLTIMPLGDSITDGQAVSPATAGYRGFLYNILAAETTGTKFVGSSTVTPGNLPAGQQNHEGHGGYRIDHLDGNLAASDGTGGNNGGFWLSGGGGTGRPELNPDVILLHIGTNDIRGGANQTTLQSRLNSLIADIWAQTPNTKILLADITPSLDSFGAATQSYNTNVVNALAASYASLGRDISVVDMHTAFPAGGMAGDGFHPVATGYSFMANQWYNALLAEYPGGANVSLPINSTVTIAPGATLDVGGNTAVIGPLAGAGSVTLGSGSLTVTSTAGNNTTFSGVISGSGSLTKAGPAKLTLTNTSTYTGATTINGGSLIVSGASGSIASSSNVTVAAGGALGGTGTVSDILLRSGGTVAPGDSPGTLFGDSLVWDGGGVMAFELSSTNPSLPGSLTDLLDLDSTGGSGAFNKGVAGVFKFDFQGSTPFFTNSNAGVYTLVDFATTNFAVSDFSFTNLNGTGFFQFDNTLSPGALQFVATPEPGRVMLFGLAALLMTGRRRRK